MADEEVTVGTRRSRPQSRTDVLPTDDAITHSDVRLFRQAAAVIFRQLRSEHGWSYREFGERVGIAHTSLHAVERADQTPSVETLSLVAQASGVPFRELLSRITAQVLVQLQRHAQSERAGASEVDGAGPVAVLETVLALSPEQQAEVARFAAWLTWRDQESGTPPPDAA